MIKAKPKKKGPLLAQIRTAVADYMWSEGCSCCSDRDKHYEDRERLGKLLRVPRKDDYYDFQPYRSKPNTAGDLQK